MLTQYLNESGVDLINIFDPQSADATNIVSGVDGIQISVLAGSTGPLNFTTNGTGAGSQNINIKSTGNLYISPNNLSAVSLTSSGITFAPNNTTCLTIDSDKIKSFNQWYYGVRAISNVSGTYTILITDPRNIFFTGSVNCNLVLPPNPPDGTEYFIRKTSTTGFTITITTNQMLRSNNTEQTSLGTTSRNIGVVYSSYVSKWICFNIGL